MSQTNTQRLTWRARVLLFRAALTLFSRAGWALFHLGNAYAERGDLDSALPLWLAAAKKPRPRWAAVSNAASTLLQQGRAEDAVAPLEAFVKSDGATNAGAFALLGRALQKAGRAAEAAGAMEQALALNPAQDAVRLMLAVHFEKNGQPERALEHYRLIGSPALAQQASARIAAIERGLFGHLR